jgi:hypothetical protein
VLNKEKMDSFKSNFYKIFHKIFKIPTPLIIPFALIVVIAIVGTWNYYNYIPKDTEPTSITETIPQSTEENKKEPTTKKEKITTTTERDIPTTQVSTSAPAPTEKPITTTVPATTVAPKPSTNFGSFKSYTDYRCLSRSSAQWKLQEQAHTDENGLRKIGDAYLVAMGSYYGTTLGTKYIVTLSSGNSFTVMLCDFKDNRHTDANNQVCLLNGSIIEFYVESDKMPSIVRQMGSVGALEQFKGGIVSIKKTT